MTLYQFNSLNEMQQADELWEKGVHIAERPEGDFELLLYQIDSFYVEVWYQRVDNKIKKIRSFSSINALEPYLKNIQIDL